MYIFQKKKLKSATFRWICGCWKTESVSFSEVRVEWNGPGDKLGSGPGRGSGEIWVVCVEWPHNQGYRPRSPHLPGSGSDTNNRCRHWQLITTNYHNQYGHQWRASLSRCGGHVTRCNVAMCGNVYGDMTNWYLGYRSLTHTPLTSRKPLTIYFKVSILDTQQ